MSAWYERVIAAHCAVTDCVSHGTRMKSERYFVWKEDGSNDLAAGDTHAEQAVTGGTELYTKTEFDPWANELGRALSEAGIAWRLAGVHFEEATGFWHHSWDWEVAV